MTVHRTALAGFFAACAGAPILAQQGAEWLSAEERRIVQAMSPVPRLLPDETNRAASDPAAVSLGSALFFDPRLSAGGKVSCASCHVPDRAWTDGRRLAHGLRDGRRNTPTLLNAAHNRWLFWDGSATVLWQQALRPLESPDEMGGDRSRIVAAVAGDPKLAKLYAAAFGSDALDVQASSGDRDRVFANIGKSLASFVATVRGDCARFDMFVAGLRNDDATLLAALSPGEVRGLRLFIGKANCVACHHGPLFTDMEFHNLKLPFERTAAGEDRGRVDGVPRLLADTFGPAGPYSDSRTGAAAARLSTLPPSSVFAGAFKTPSLRNVRMTAPYMHNGIYATLDEVLHHYSEMEDAALIDHHDDVLLRPLKLAQTERSDIVEFLGTLTDTVYDPSPSLARFCRARIAKSGSPAP